MTKGQFAGKAKKLSLIAKLFIARGVVPSEDLRYDEIDDDTTIEQIFPTEAPKTPEEKLKAMNKQKHNKEDLFIFFTYHDGFSTNGRIGFNPEFCIGSINHYRAYHCLIDNLTDSDFCNKAKTMGMLAKEFVDNGIEIPSEVSRPVYQRRLPTSLQAAAGYNESADEDEAY